VAAVRRLAVRAALLDGVPGDPDHPGRTAIKLDNGTALFSLANCKRRSAVASCCSGAGNIPAASTATTGPGPARAMPAPMFAANFR